MSNLEKYLQMLQSEKASVRYEACEELRVRENLPKSALLALQTATNDNDSLVADAARRALLLHSESAIADQSSVDNAHGVLERINPILSRSNVTSYSKLFLFFGLMMLLAGLWGFISENVAWRYNQSELSSIIFCVGGGAVLTLISAITWIGRTEWNEHLKYSEIAQGKIIECDDENNSVLVQFNTNGKTLILRVNFGVDNYQKFPLNKEVTIRYSPDNPQIALIEGDYDWL